MEKKRTASRSVSVEDVPSSDLRAKVAAASAVFDAGKKICSFAPPWGILTGVRPAKLVTQMVADGMDYPSIRRKLTKEYFVSPKKASLAINVSRCEQKILKKIPENTCSIYISIPFCPSRCSYCSFISYATKKLISLIPDYLTSLCDDIRRIGRLVRSFGIRVQTIYIGGGTPSILSVDQMKTLLDTICSSIDMSGVEEFSLEAGRPDTITPEKIRAAMDHFVGRVCVNTQTLTDHILEDIGRKHTSADYFRAFDIVRSAGISCINTDLIAGLPGDSFSSFSRSLDRVMELRPENLTIHTFCVKKAAEILQIDRDIYNHANSDVVTSVDYSQIRAKMAGYYPYYLYRQKNTAANLENVGFTLDGHECLYNVLMMEEVQSIFACGAGAITKLVSSDHGKIRRFAMPKYPYEYLDFASSPEKSSAYYDSIENWLSENAFPRMMKETE